MYASRCTKLSRSRQVVPRKAGAVLEQHVLGREANALPELLGEFERIIEGVRAAFFLGGDAQQQFGVQIVADFIGQPHVLEQGRESVSASTVRDAGEADSSGSPA